MGEAVGTSRQSAAPPRRATFRSVLGELLLTLGVVTLLYVAWQLWIGDVVIGAEKSAQAASLSQTWRENVPEIPEDVLAAPGGPASIPALPPAAPGEQFGIMRIPRFGNAWMFTIAGGISREDVLDEGRIGHYPDTAMPGAVGNTAYAAHRWTAGAPFDPIDRLVVGDAIVIETPGGWYTYRFRTLEYVQDTEVDVLLPVPQASGVASEGRYLTLTSCAPKFDVLERVVAYAVFEDFTPLGAGPPASLTVEEVA